MDTPQTQEPDELHELRQQAERLAAFIESVSPGTVGYRLLEQAEERLAVIYGRIERYTPFGPY